MNDEVDKLIINREVITHDIKQRHGAGRERPHFPWTPGFYGNPGILDYRDVFHAYKWKIGKEQTCQENIQRLYSRTILYTPYVEVHVT